MSRVKRGVTAHARHKKVLKAAKGYYGRRKNTIRAAKAAVDMMDFALQKPFDSIHQACEEQHTGEDGVSKTWTDLELALSGTFEKSCD